MPPSLKRFKDRGQRILFMLVFDTHLHISYYSSCAVITPEELIQQAIQVRLDGIAITEHGIRWPNEKLDGLRRLADPHGLILINGSLALVSLNLT